MKDGAGRVILQVRLLTDRVQLQGIFYDATGKWMYFGESINGDGEGGNILFGGIDTKNTVPPKIEPIFKYPSNRHLGEHLETGPESVATVAASVISFSVLVAAASMIVKRSRSHSSASAA